MCDTLSDVTHMNESCPTHRSGATRAETLRQLSRQCCIQLVISPAGVQCIAVCCSVMQCVVVCCSVLQCVAVCCSSCVSTAPFIWSSHLQMCRVLQCVAVCCIVLQCVAVRCIVLQCVAALESAVSHSTHHFSICITHMT